MDKEILRLVIIVTGVLVIIGMVFWSIVKNRRSSKPLDWRVGGKKSLKNIDPSLVLHPENDDFDVVPLGSPLAENDDITGIEPQRIAPVQARRKAGPSRPSERAKIKQKCRR